VDAWQLTKTADSGRMCGRRSRGKYLLSPEEIQPPQGSQPNRQGNFKWGIWVIEGWLMAVEVI